MTRYIIVDDEHIAHDIIKGYCDLLPNMKLLKHCYDAIEALDFLRINSVDLIFLDLNMPKLRGFDFLRALQRLNIEFLMSRKIFLMFLSPRTSNVIAHERRDS